MKCIISILFIISSLHGYSQIDLCENLVFEGAGIRGIAYSGVLRQFEQSGAIQNIKKVGGTSAGAVTALMVSLGYTSDEMYQIISATKFQKFNDGQFMFVGGFSRINKNYGWYRGNEFTKWLEQIIEDKTGNADITFKELQEKQFKQLFVTATCINKQKLIIFSAETYPDMKVKDAVRISMSIPLYFEAVFIDSVGHVYKKHKDARDLDVVVDGGIIANFPIFMFDSIALDSLNHKIRIPNDKTIGVRIDSDEQIKMDSLDKELTPIQIDNVSDYLSAFYIIIIENLNRNTLIPEDWKRTISVSSVGMSPKIKKLSKEQKEALISSGERYTMAFINRKR